MRIRDFKWSTDVVGPTTGILLVVWGVAGGSAQIVFGGTALLVVTTVYLMQRVERRQSDGSYGRLLSSDWYRWVDPRGLIASFAASTIIVLVALFLAGVPLYIAVPVGLALALCWILVLAWARRTRLLP